MSTKEQTATVKVGSKVQFKWNYFHNVYQFNTAKAFKACDFKQAKLVCAKSPCTITPKKVGTFYYSCKVGSHCKFQQKLALKVTGDSKPKTCICNKMFKPV